MLIALVLLSKLCAGDGNRSNVVPTQTADQMIRYNGTKMLSQSMNHDPESDKIITKKCSKYEYEGVH